MSVICTTQIIFMEHYFNIPRILLKYAYISLLKKLAFTEKY